MTWDFDSIPKYVINLDRRTDRWLQFQSVTGFQDLKHLRRWSAVDGKLINIDEDNNISLFTKYNIVRGVRRSHMELNSKGGVGCYYSHVDAWTHFLNNETSEVAIIFEDDTIVDTTAVERMKNFIEKSPVIQNPEMWDFCILAPTSGAKKHDALYQDDPTCIRLVGFNGMIGYLINKKGVKKILPMVFPVQGHIDWFLSICAQLQYIELCCPEQSLLGYRLTRTDIHETNKCEICDIENDFGKNNELVTRSRLKMLQLEEITLIMMTLYFGILYFKKR